MGLQREVTPQPDPKDGENMEGEEFTVTVGGPPMTETGDTCKTNIGDFIVYQPGL